MQGQDPPPPIPTYVLPHGTFRTENAKYGGPSDRVVVAEHLFGAMNSAFEKEEFKSLAYGKKSPPVTWLQLHTFLDLTRHDGSWFFVANDDGTWTEVNGHVTNRFHALSVKAMINASTAVLQSRKPASGPNKAWNKLLDILKQLSDAAVSEAFRQQALKEMKQREQIEKAEAERRSKERTAVTDTGASTSDDHATADAETAKDGDDAETAKDGDDVEKAEKAAAEEAEKAAAKEAIDAAAKEAIVAAAKEAGDAVAMCLSISADVQQNAKELTASIADAIEAFKKAKNGLNDDIDAVRTAVEAAKAAAEAAAEKAVKASGVADDCATFAQESVYDVTADDRAAAERAAADAVAAAERAAAERAAAERAAAAAAADKTAAEVAAAAAAADKTAAAEDSKTIADLANDLRGDMAAIRQAITALQAKSASGNESDV